MLFRSADNTGREPKVGDYVAYNYSGQIALGHITRVSKDRRTFTIRQRFPDDEHVSRVRGGPKCLLVLSASQPEVRAANLERLGR